MGGAHIDCFVTLRSRQAYFVPRKDTDHCGSFNLEMELVRDMPAPRIVHLLFINFIYLYHKISITYPNKIIIKLSHFFNGLLL